MPSLERIRNEMDVRRSPQNKALILTIRVTASHDGGMMRVMDNPVHGWLGANCVIANHLQQFERLCEEGSLPNFTVD